MLRYFRIIRKKLIEQDNVRKYILYAIGEILLVVIGILIALQVNNWNEERKKQKEERHYMERLHLDVSDDIVMLRQRQELWSRQMQLGLEALAVKEMPTGDPERAWEIVRAFHHASNSVPLHLRDATYIDMVSSGQLGLIADTDLRDFATLYYNSSWAVDRGFIDSKKKYEAGSAPETLDLHFLPFKHGMLYIGNTEPLSKKSLDLGQSMAKAFSVAYDRYEDFNKLEQAKQKIEEAFRELEAAKDQLVQQEKLASLGQLTAGIAHEIKNPLNFVNNFSEVSLEMVEEARHEIRDMRREFEDEKGESPLEGSAEAERRRGVSDEAKNETPSLILEILDDIEANLRKIHEHGTRADSIVKSMLQHSRGGDGKMEPSPLNPLVKEYVNLAFHGMRAGKEPIDVDIDLQLDENVGEVPLVAEDFSRVVLNLCNNAFDAMREKINSELNIQNSKFSPKLIVRTHQTDNSISIEIEDNGPGIPEEIKDKIMQPFFTTKKGTQGTGLGLSITNDIVKAHGGVLTISTQAGKRTTFNIELPKSGL